MSFSVEYFQEIAEQVWARHHPYWWFDIDVDDAKQVAVMRCLKVAKHFDPAKMAARSFFSMVARQEITKINARERRWRRFHKSIDKPLKPGGDATWASLLPSLAPEVVEPLIVVDTAENVREAVRGLPENQRMVVEGVLADRTVSEIARERGVSVAAVSKTYRTALHNLKMRRYRTPDLTEAV